jgi:FkbM family methyltransferase
MKPSKYSFCKFLADTQFPLSCIIDVGVLTDTYDLRINFPNVKQILIEPQIKYNDIIKENYKNNIFELINIGCDEKEDLLYLHSENIFDEKCILPSHNRISNNHSDIVVKVDTLNNISEKIDNWILLKIDVDDKEIDILKGANLCLKKCAFVIIEATVSSFNEISNILCDSGFTLFNIVDICYLKNAFSQCDLIFINNNIKKLHEEFDPCNNIICDENIYSKYYYQFNP